MINVSPIGRNASTEERNEFERYDKVRPNSIRECGAHPQIHNVRKAMLLAMRKEFAHLNLTFSIGGQISFDAFPNGTSFLIHPVHTDKQAGTRLTHSTIFKTRVSQTFTFSATRCVWDRSRSRRRADQQTYEGGNDYEIFSDERTIGHTVVSPDDTLQQLNELFLSKY